MFKLFRKIASPFARLGSRLGQKIRTLFSKGVDESSYEDLERMFYEADLGAALSAELVEHIRSLLRKTPELSTDNLLQAIRAKLLSWLEPAPTPKEALSSPHVILITGVNGSGKTTSLAKLANLYRSAGKRVLIAAADTFRAASVEQLERWTETVGAELVRPQSQGDPSAVVFDALAKAKARGFDIVLIDTAGRLQAKTELMNELAKIRRISQKQLEGAPHETLLVLDATIGQNALDQARAFHEVAPLSGIVLTKLDGSAKGGIAVAIHKDLKIPILWVGTGEGAGDLQPFDPEAFVDALLNLGQN